MRVLTTFAGATLAAAALLQPERAQAQQAEDAAAALQTQASTTVTVAAAPREIQLGPYEKVLCTVPAGPAGEELATALTGLGGDVYVAPERIARLCDGVISAGGPFSNGDVDVIAAQLRVEQVHREKGPAAQRLRLLLDAAKAVVKAQDPRVTRDEQGKDEKAVDREVRRFEQQLDYEYAKPAIEFRMNAALTPPAYRNVWQWLSLGRP